MSRTIVLRHLCSIMPPIQSGGSPAGLILGAGLEEIIFLQNAPLLPHKF